MPDALRRYIDELTPAEPAPFTAAVAAAGRRRTRRRLTGAAAVLGLAALSTAGWVARPGESDRVNQVADGAPDRMTVDGQEVFLDGGGGIVAISQDPADPLKLVVIAGARVTGLRPECRRYPAVRVVEQTAAGVRLVVDSYAGQREPEPECPQVRGDLLDRTVQLDAPLGDRDVREGVSTLVLLVNDRQVPGRTPLPGTPSCASTSSAHPSRSDYANFIHHDGKFFVSREPETVPASSRGAQVGKVSCRLSSSYTPFDYAPRDGDAAYLATETPYFIARDRVDALIAEFNGSDALFVHDPSLG